MPAIDKQAVDDRVKKVYNDLKDRRIVFNQTDFWSSLEILKSSGSYIFAEPENPHKRHFPAAKYETICQVYGVDRSWLETGVGEMYTESNQDRVAGSEDHASPRIIYRNEGGPGKAPVPFYDIKGTMSVVRSFSDMRVEPEFWVDFKPFNDCTAYVSVYGDSMFPKYRSGQVLAIKQMNNYDTLLWGEAYFVITDAEANEMRTVKLLFPHDDPDKIILRASNPSYKGDTVIKKECVLSLYIIKGDVNISHL